MKVLTHSLNSRLDLETLAGKIFLFGLGCVNILDSSTALNRNFSNIVRKKIHIMKLPEGSRTAGRVYAKCIMDFENRIKADFRNNGQKWAVDVGIDVGIEAEFPEAGIEEGYMTFTNDEILQCFGPVINRIDELIRNQVAQVQTQNATLKVHPPYL